MPGKITGEDERQDLVRERQDSRAGDSMYLKAQVHNSKQEQRFHVTGLDRDELEDQ